MQRLAGEVSDARAVKHLEALQRIADEHGGNRAAGTSGYDASVEYVVDVLRDAGFKPSTPTFESSDGDGERQRAAAQRHRPNPHRDPGQVVMIGAHLDSVEDGPGIVDNGSGVATLLEIATQLGADPAVKNTVRFAFFGDEESGAQGSTGYVEGLSAENRNKIKLYLNVDMVASPNGGYFAQGGKGNGPEEAGPAGSATIGRVLADQLVRTGVTNPEVIEFVGDDESPFIEAGIPVGGAESGDDEEKTARQAKAWAGRPARSMTGATTRRATPSTTSTATCWTITCGPSPAPWPTSQHPQTNCADAVQVESKTTAVSRMPRFRIQRLFTPAGKISSSMSCCATALLA